MRRQKVELYFNVLLIVLAALAAALSLKTYITDSEFWAITLAKKLGETATNTSLSMKFIFYGLLKPLYWLPLDNVSHVLFARLEFAAIGCITAWVFYLTVRLVFTDVFMALVLTLVLSTSSFFLSQSFRVRSDNLASLIALGIFALILKASRSRGSNWLRNFGVIAICNLGLLAVTPKSFYFLITGAVFSSFLPFEGLTRVRHVLGVAVGFLLPPFLVITPLALLSNLEIAQTFHSTAQSAFEYFLDSFSSSTANGGYLSATDFRHLFRFITQNPLQDGFFLCATFAWFLPDSQNKLLNRERRAFAAVFTIVLFLLLFHNQKLPFFIYSLLPFLVLSSGVALHGLYFRFSNSKYFEAFLATGLSLGVISALYIAQQSVAENSNQAQIEQLRFLQAFLKKENVSSYYDGIGLLPRENTIYAFPSPGDRHNDDILKSVIALKPALILYVNRLQNLEPLLTYELMNHYYDIGGGIWARAIKPESIAGFSKGNDGTCHLPSEGLEATRSSNLGESNHSLMSFGFGQDGHNHRIETATQNGFIEFHCGEDRVWFSTFAPIAGGVPIDYKFLFAFDLFY